MTELEGYTRAILFVAVAAGAGILYFLNKIQTELRELRKDLRAIYTLTNLNEQRREKSLPSR